MAEKLVLITGATGHQGGATLRHLARRGGFKLRALTRAPDGAWGVYSVQNTWEAGVEKEEVQGKRLAQLARDKHVQRFVYASVGSAHKATGIPHFDNKYRVEQVVKALGFPSYAIIRPVFFMENLLTPWSLAGDKLTFGLSPYTKLQMIAADDIGKFGAKAFVDAEAMKNVERDIAGDAITMTEAAGALSPVVGKTLTFHQIPIDVVRQQSEDVARMAEWFEKVGYSADIATQEQRFGIQALTFAEWVRTLPSGK